MPIPIRAPTESNGVKKTARNEEYRLEGQDHGYEKGTQYEEQQPSLIKEGYRSVHPAEKRKESRMPSA